VQIDRKQQHEVTGAKSRPNQIFSKTIPSMYELKVFDFRDTFSKLGWGIMLDGMLGLAIFLVASIKAMFVAASQDFLKPPVNLAFKFPDSCFMGNAAIPMDLPSK
jgi:hypothetical protein